MSASGFTFLAITVLVTALGTVLIRWVRSGYGGPAAPLAPATIAWRLAGVAGGGIGACVVAGVDRLGGGLLLAAPVACLGVLIGVIGGELAVRRPRTEMRAANIRVRRASDYVPRRLTAGVTTGAVSLAAVLLLTTALGSPDDLGRVGRSLARACDAGTSLAVGPWPGSYYTVPLGGVLAAGLVLTSLALRSIVRRPGVEDLADHSRRAVSAEVVVGALGILVAVPAFGVCAVAAETLLTFDCPAPTWTFLGWVLIVTLPAFVALLGGSIAAVVAPRNPVPARARA